MYIWRGKNRRDKRNLLLAGETYWGAPKEAINYVHDDEILRYEGEKKHVDYFSRKIELLMSQYLDTPEGKIEVDLIKKELKKTKDRQSHFRDFNTLDTNAQETMKNNIFQIYRMFSFEYSDYIDRKGLKDLLSYIEMPISDRAFDKYARKLKLTEVNLEIHFDVFYANLLEQIATENKKRKGWLKMFRFTSMTPQDTVDEQVEEELGNEATLTARLHDKLVTIESKLVLVDCAVKRAEKSARAEYRIAHPSKLLCETCGESFPERAFLIKHVKDNAYHRDLLRQKIIQDEKQLHVDKIFEGINGRKLRANRLIFSRELDNLDTRVNVAVIDPFRPHLADPEGKRYNQQLKGSYVQGFDAKSGIRVGYRQNGLTRQHLAPLRNKSAVNSIIQKSLPVLQDVLTDLLRCKDDFIDTVSTYDTYYESLIAYATDNGLDVIDYIAQNESKVPMYATVRIQFNGFADGAICIIGEFNGWKPEPMISDAVTGKWFVVKQLCPGRYCYRFLIDGKECLDEVASWTADERTPMGNNVLLVTNNAIMHHVEQKRRGKGMIQSGLILPVSITSPLKLLKSQQQQQETSQSQESIAIWKSQSQSHSNTRDDDNSVGTGAVSRASTAASRVSTASSYYEGKIIHISRTDKKELLRRLNTINLRNSALYDDGIWALANYVHKNSFILSLDLSYNYISDDGIQALGSALPNMQALTDLKLNGNGFGYDGVKCLIDNMNDKKTLTNLELSNNRIGDDGFELICEHLYYNENILHLYLDSCLIGNEGAVAFHHALLLNNTLLSISLSGNNILVYGIDRLCKALEDNACLSALNLNNNPIGPDGARFIGEMLVVNNSIKSLELANIDLMRTQSSYGIHHLCIGLLRNTGLTYLNLRNNMLSLDHIVVEIADTLRLNNSLTSINLEGNQIKENKWFLPDTYIHTKLNKEMPSIETSLEKNRRFAKAREEREAEVPSRVKQEMDQVKKGRWTNRRVWKRVIETSLEKIAAKDAIATEHLRIEEEKVYIKAMLDEHMNLMKNYLEERPCRAYVAALARFIVQYFQNLPKVEVHHLPERQLNSGSGVVNNRASIRAESIKLRVSSPAVNPDSTKGTSSSFMPVGTRDLLKSMSLSRLSFTAPQPPSSKSFPDSVIPSDINMPAFLNAHISVLMSIFTNLGNGLTPMMINVESIEQAFQMLGLPIPREEVQTAVDETLVKNGVYKIGLHKFSEYILANAKRLCAQNQLKRFRIHADMLINPPVDEAKSIIYDNLHHLYLVEIRDKYRATEEYKPLFVCQYCKKRYATQKGLNRHLEKGYNSADHKRHRVKEVIHRSQLLFLQEVKQSITGVFFPAYYELGNAKLWPDNYFPQVMDKIGAEGRPIGVVEPNRTIRALDVFGEYLHVLLHNELGWIRYRIGHQEMLQPACKGKPGFDWDTMHIQDTITYYRVNDALPDEVELKVRHMPLLEGEVCGYLKANQIIECLAVIGDWLQVRYEKQDAAWVMWRTTRGTDKQTNQIILKTPVTVNRPKRDKKSEKIVAKSNKSSWDPLESTCRHASLSIL